MYSKEELGRGTWTLIHGTFESVSDPPTYQERKAITEFLRASAGSYPCKVCRPGFRYIDEHPPDFSSRKALVTWGCSWHNSINEHLSKPLKDCDEVVASIGSCPTCSIPKKYEDRRPMPVVKYSDMVDAIITEECAKYGVPKPQVVYDPDPAACPGTSCTLLWKDNKRAPVIILNPQAASLRTSYHELEHYFAALLGPDRLRTALGSEYSGYADSEEDAERYARGKIHAMYPSGASSLAPIAASDRLESINMVEPPQSLMSTTELVHAPTASTDSYEIPQVFEDSESGFFRKLDRVYGWTSKYTKVDASATNMAYTPEVLGTLVETGLDAIFTPLGSIVANFIFGGFLAFAGATAQMSSFDRAMLKNWEAHHTTRVLTYVNPNNMQALSLQAKQIGAMTARGQGGQAIRQYALRNQGGAVASGFRAIENAFRGIGLPAQARAAPRTPAGSQMRATQFSQPGGRTNIPNFQ